MAQTRAPQRDRSQDGKVVGRSTHADRPTALIPPSGLYLPTWDSRTYMDMAQTRAPQRPIEAKTARLWDAARMRTARPRTSAACY